MPKIFARFLLGETYLRIATNHLLTVFNKLSPCLVRTHQSELHFEMGQMPSNITYMYTSLFPTPQSRRLQCLEFLTLLGHCYTDDR